MGYSGNMYATATEVITSQGDLRRGDSSGNPERLAIGSTGKFLKSNGTTESWETVSAGATTTYTDEKLSSDFTTDVAVSGGDPVDITGLAVTLGGSGKFIAQANGGVYTSGGAGTAPVWDIVHDGTIIRRMGTSTSAAGRSMGYTNGAGGTCDSTIVKLQINSPVGITTARGTGDYLTGLWVMEIA